jgi:ABC-type glycerol-3-phosphate transport system substrate-binding protein
MNAMSRDKDTAWEFMEWATGKDFLLQSVFEGNMNPTRSSVWDHPRFHEFSSNWGSFTAVSRQLAEEVGGVLVTPAVNYIDVARRWTTALRAAYVAPNFLEVIMSAAARDIDRLVTR